MKPPQNQDDTKPVGQTVGLHSRELAVLARNNTRKGTKCLSTPISSHKKDTGGIPEEEGPTAARPTYTVVLGKQPKDIPALLWQWGGSGTPQDGDRHAEGTDHHQTGTVGWRGGGRMGGRLSKP